MNTNVIEWLENIKSKYPNKTVFSDTKNTIDFSTVMTYAKAIGSLIADKCVGKAPVAVFSGRHILTPVAFLGAIYGGCFYAPIDSKLPKARIEQILDTLKPALILTDSSNKDFVKDLGFDNDKIIIIEEAVNYKINEDRLGIIHRFSNENDPLYVIFTSGSTGKPKGVITSHHSLMCYIEAYSEVMGINESDILGNQSPLDYIAAIRDIYLPLLHGCSTVIIPKELFMTPVKLFDYMNDRKITSIGWSVSALTVPTSLGAFNHSKPSYLKKVCFSGSVMPCKCLKIWQQSLPDTLFVNQYGPTEATASCTYYVVKEPVDDDDVLPIGLPYKNYNVFLLNEDGSPANQGDEGEICVSGPILALGYYNDPERTKQAFVQNPNNNLYRELIYKTGDIGLQRADDIFEFHGRKDRQIKHMGHRVELDEIEYAAYNISEISECCVLYNKEKETLWLFYVGQATVKTIATELRKTLPGFMIPRKIINLEVMPKLPNGKIDMTKLKEYFK